ncbi:18927_t:CDS:10, partial [Dentiscutata erythropus]
MASNVVVLLPNAKRQTVKTTPTMPLKQIVNAVCEKQGYTDVEIYGLKLNKKTLDLGLSMRFANLAPGAKLELIKVSAPKAQKDVQIALQLDDGGRMIEKFPITTSIWDIILHFEKTSANGSLNLTRRTAPAPPKKGFSLKKFSKSSETQFYQQPVCLILNREYGTISLLKSTTLQSAGITSGNAVLRLLFRQTELTLTDVVNIEASPPKELTDTVLTLDNQQKEPINTMNVSDKQQKVPIDTMNVSDEQQKEPNDTMNVLDVQQKEPIDTMNVSDEQQKEPIDTMNVSDEQQKEPIDSTNDLDEQQKKPIDIMNDPDEQSKEPVDTTINDPIEQPKEPIDTTMNDPDEQPKKPIDAMNSPDEQPKEPIDITMNDPNEQPKEQIGTVGHFDRDIKVFNPPPENALMSNQIDLPDSFFELTATELKYLLAKQTLKHQRDENAGFKTNAMRAQEEKERERKYPKTLIRVKFPDSFQLQIAFLSKEHVADLYKFVKDALRTPNREFELYVSPPKRTLSDKNLTLYQAGLAPASVVYCIWADKSVGNDAVPYLSDEYLKLREDIPNITPMEITEDTSASESLSVKSNDVVHQQRNDSSKNRERKEKVESSD